MKTKLSLLILFLFFCQLAYSQTDFRPGFIISNSGDTIYGQIDYRGDLLMSTVCKFKKNKDTETVDYYPTDIKAFRFTNSKYFESKEVKTETGNKEVFLEALIKGEVNIYYYRGINGEHYFVEKEGLGLAELPYKEEVLLQEDGKRYLAVSKRHVGLLKVYMNDAPSLTSRIENFEKIEHNSIKNLAEDYHNKVCKYEECIIYEKKQPFLKIHPELVLRVINFQGVEVLKTYVDRNYYYPGLLLNIQVPSINEKIYLTTGILRIGLEKKHTPYSKYTNPDEKIEPMAYFLKFPLHLGYLYPKGLVRPRIAYGLNLYHPFYVGNRFITNSLTTGAYIKFYKSFGLTVFAEGEFNTREKFAILPSSLLSYSLGTGLYISL